MNGVGGVLHGPDTEPEWVCHRACAVLADRGSVTANVMGLVRMYSAVRYFGLQANSDWRML